MFRLFALSGLVLAATPAMAVTTTIFVSGDSGTHVDSTTTGAQALSSATPDGFFVAQAAAGVLKSAALFVSPALPVDGFASNSLGSTVSVTDIFTVNAAGITSGSFIATLLIDGSLTPFASSFQPSGNVGFAAFSVKVELPDSGTTVFDFSYTMSNYNGFVGDGGGSLNGQRYTGAYTGPFSFSIPFENLIGQNVKISLFCGVTGITVRAGDTAGGDCGFDHTVTWGGVSQVLNNLGTPVPGASITGGSGANYVNSFAVPEPAQWALLIAGFGLVGAVQRRQRVMA